MLSILLLLAAAPQSVIPSMPPPAPTPPAATPVLGQPPAGRAPATQRASDPTARNGLMWREGQDPVGHYLLLDRYVAGCPDPIVVRYRVPGSDAVGREIGRAPVAPVITPRR